MSRTASSSCVPLPPPCHRRLGRVSSWVLTMASPNSALHSLTDAVCSLSCSPQSILHVPEPSSRSSPTMKDVSNSVRPTRPAVYPKKRPSPHGVSKSRRQSPPLCPAQAVARKSPRATKAEILAQRQREAHITALRREGIFLEEEYRDEIRFYMHEMEVSRGLHVLSDADR